MNIILIPIFNDWKSLNQLLFQINENADQNDITQILIINDCSTKEIDIDKTHLGKIEKIKILTLKQNLGSQKSIALGLNYLKKLNSNFYVTIMDGDGEDNPSKIKQMIDLAKKNQDYVVTSNRKGRNENLLIKTSYKVHLVACFFLTWNWISFGNFSCFHSRNLKKILLNNNIWLAYSAGVLKNCKIKKIYTKRQKRYFEKSKVSFLNLIEHSLRILGVFYKRVLISSFFYLCVIIFFFPQINYLFYFLIAVLNLTILFVRFKNLSTKPMNYKDYMKDLIKI